MQSGSHKTQRAVVLGGMGAEAVEAQVVLAFEDLKTAPISRDICGLAAAAEGAIAAAGCVQGLAQPCAQVDRAAMACGFDGLAHCLGTFGMRERE